MTQLKIIVNSLPRDLAEFSFFLIIGFTAGYIGLIWFNLHLINLFIFSINKLLRYILVAGNLYHPDRVIFFNISYVLIFDN